MKRAAVIAHGGGPTVVLNASLAGVMHEWRQRAEGKLYGAVLGVQGLLEGNWIELSAETDEVIEGLKTAPGSAIGSSRKEIPEGGYERLLQQFRDRGVGYFFYTGGNGSMETAMMLHRAAQAAGDELQVIGIPKTIDNDLSETDHTPGYGSAARFAAHAVRDIGEDNRSLAPPIEVVEIIGRNAGWVVGSTALARHYADDAPHLIYFPERPLSRDQLLSDVESCYRQIGRVTIAVCEGQRDDRGQVFGADVDRGSTQHTLASNLGHSLARIITEGLKIRARAEKPGLLGRSASFLASEVDRAESFRCGQAAVRAAEAGASGCMVALQRVSDEPYACETVLVPLERVARAERTMPAEMISPSGNDVTEAFLRYVTPLVGGVSAHTRLAGRL